MVSSALSFPDQYLRATWWNIKIAMITIAFNMLYQIFVYDILRRIVGDHVVMVGVNKLHAIQCGWLKGMPI